MNVSIEPDGPCRQILNIELPAETVQAEFDTVTRDVVQGARIPGFRPGRAPRAMVERRFARSIAEQVREQLLPKYYQKAIEQEGIKPVTVIRVDHGEPEQGQSLTFRITVDLPPDFQVPDYASIDITDQTATIQDSDVDATLLNLRRRGARYQEVDRPARENDLVFFDYDGTLDGAPLTEVAGDCHELGSGRDVAMVMNRDREILPGLFDGLLGVRKEEERSLNAVFPADHPVAAVAGKTVVYQVRVKTVREEELPPLDDAFFKSMQAADETDLRQKIRDGLTTAAAQREQERRVGAVTRHLLDNAPIETLPQSLVEEESRAVLQNLVRDFTAQGVAHETITENRDQIMQMADRTSQERVRLHAIMDRIAEQENLTVADDELKAYVDRMAQRGGIPVAQAWKTIQRRNAAQDIMDQMRRSKTMALLMDRVRILPADPDAAAAQTKDESQ